VGQATLGTGPVGPNSGKDSLYRRATRNGRAGRAAPPPSPSCLDRGSSRRARDPPPPPLLSGSPFAIHGKRRSGCRAIPGPPGIAERRHPCRHLVRNPESSPSMARHADLKGGIHAAILSEFGGASLPRPFRRPASCRACRFRPAPSVAPDTRKGKRKKTRESEFSRLFPLPLFVRRSSPPPPTHHPQIIQAQIISLKGQAFLPLHTSRPSIPDLPPGSLCPDGAVVGGAGRPLDHGYRAIHQSGPPPPTHHPLIWQRVCHLRSEHYLFM